MIRLISAVTFAVRDMARAIEFYKKLGFELLYGGERATFSSLKAGEAFVNLNMLAPSCLPRLHEAKEAVAIPARSRYSRGDGAQRRIGPAVVFQSRRRAPSRLALWISSF